MHTFSTITFAASVIGLAQADFYFGVLSGAMAAGDVSHGSIDAYTTEIILIGDQSICDADTFGGDPPEPQTDPNAPNINWCDQPIDKNDAKLVLNPNDDCGSSHTGNEHIPDGTFYADVWDMNDNNKTVGRCVYELGGNSKTCPSDGNSEGSTSVHCYTDAL